MCLSGLLSENSHPVGSMRSDCSQKSPIVCSCSPEREQPNCLASYRTGRCPLWDRKTLVSLSRIHQSRWLFQSAGAGSNGPCPILCGRCACWNSPPFTVLCDVIRGVWMIVLYKIQFRSELITWKHAFRRRNISENIHAAGADYGITPPYSDFPRQMSLNW
jgi:hypothetical protein